MQHREERAIAAIFFLLQDAFQTVKPHLLLPEMSLQVVPHDVKALAKVTEFGMRGTMHSFHFVGHLS
jgi:hypothetical protein